MTDAHGVARDQLRAFVERIERLEEEKKTIADDIKDVYGEAKSMGFDTKILKQVIALRKKDDQERTEEELIRDTYLQALGMIPDFEPEPDPTPTSPEPTKSPAMALQSPRKAAEAVSERTRNAVGRPTSERQPKAVGSEEDGVTGGESAATNSPETANETPKQVYGDSGAEATALPSKSVDIPATGDQGHEIDGSNDRCPGELHSPEQASPSDDGAIAAVKGKARLANVADVEPSSSAPIAPASHGEAEAPSVERVRPQADEAITGSADANTGGGHVDVQDFAATHQAGPDLVRTSRPAAFTLRPNCRNPGPTCAGHGSNHCHACTVAMREREEA